MGLGRVAVSGFRWNTSAHRYASWPGLPASPRAPSQQPVNVSCLRAEYTCMHDLPCSAHLVVALCCGFRIHRGKTLGLVPITVVSSLCVLCTTVRFSVVLCLHRVSWIFAVWGPPRENPGHRPNNRDFHMSRLVFLSLPVTPRHMVRCILWFGQQLGLPGCDALLGPVLLRKHQGAASRYLGWFWDDQLRKQLLTEHEV